MKQIFCLLSLLLSFCAYSQEIEIDKGVLICNNDTLKLKKDKTNIYELLSEKRGENMFFADNETHYSFLDTCYLTYVLKFNVEENLLQKDVVTLHFKYIDTYANIFLNGKQVAKTKNAFRTYDFDVKGLLKEGENELVVEIESIYQKWQNVNSDDFNILHSEKRAVFRKAAFQFGWDWAPRQLAGEISLPVVLSFEDKVEKLRFASIQTSSISDKKAIMLITLKTDFLVEESYDIEIKYQTKNKTIVRKKIGEIKSENKDIHRLNFQIENPILWYPNGYGEPNLYNATIYLYTKDNVIVDSTKTRFGVRTIELSQKKDKYGSEFCFVVNGKKIFVKGANLVPSAMHKERYEGVAEHIDLVKDCNMNMLRVWGGGYYVDEKMYEACDENGILIWQDFPFACALYPASEEFLKEVELEAEENVLRISSHASLAVWCGNNEIWEGWGNWSWDKEVKDTALAVENYNKLFRTLLPDIINTYSPNTSYTHSSPLNGWGRKESLTEGDCHYWGVWWGDSTLETYTRKVPRFMSEYGFQSAPNMKTVKKYYTQPYTKENPGFAIHQKHNRGFELIENRILERFDSYETNEDYIKKTYLVASDAFSIGIESHLRAMPYCMGSLTWQLNEPYPAIGWSCIDVDYRKKEVYNTIQQSFAPIVVSVDKYSSNDSIFVYIINSSWEDVKTNLTIKITDCKNNISYQKKLNDISIKEMTSNIVLAIAKKDIKDFNPQTHKAEIECTYYNKEKKKVTLNKTIYFDYPKNLKCK